VRAQVTADVDFSNVEQMDESYKPNQAADRATIRSQSSTDKLADRQLRRTRRTGRAVEPATGPATAPINGQAGAANPASTSPGSSAHREQTTNFEVDKNVRHTKTASGEIRRLSAAVVINNKPAPPAASSPAAPGAAGRGGTRSAGRSAVVAEGDGQHPGAGARGDGIQREAGRLAERGQRSVQPA